MQITKDVWIFSQCVRLREWFFGTTADSRICRPFLRYGFIPIGGRSTAIKLQNGDVWVLASTPLTESTRQTLDKLGPVKYIVGGDIEHTLYLGAQHILAILFASWTSVNTPWRAGEFHKAYPDAKLIADKRVVRVKSKDGMQFAGGECLSTSSVTLPRNLWR